MIEILDMLEAIEVKGGKLGTAVGLGGLTVVIGGLLLGFTAVLPKLYLGVQNFFM